MTNHIEVLRGLVYGLRDLAEQAMLAYRGDHASGTFRAVVQKADELDAALAAMGAPQQPEARDNGPCLQCGDVGQVDDSVGVAPCPRCRPQQPEAQAGGAVLNDDGSLTYVGQRHVVEYMTVEIRAAIALMERIQQRAEAIDCQPTTQPAKVPEGYVLVPVEPTPEIIAGAAAAIWPTASAADIDLARKAAPIVLMSYDLSADYTVDELAAVLATMAPAYRAMLAAAPAPKEGV